MTNCGANASLLSKSSSKNPPWSPPENPEIVRLRIEFHETELQRRVKQAGGKWNSAKRVWKIHDDHAVAIGLKKRIVKLEVSDIKHHQASNIEVI